MNIIWPRFLRLPYRREPVVSFIVIAGAVEAAIGGLGEHWSLMAFGLSTIGIAITLRWWQRQQPAMRVKQAPLYALPPRPSLPVLSLPKQKPTNGKR